jgi:DNA-binding LytR/AlgR family response regulator
MSSEPVNLLRVIVVDDELPARKYLASLLGRHASVTLVDTADDSIEALRVLHQQPIDVVFLDVRMPGLDGMELARVLNRFERPPLIVFVTAYEDHALDAFGVHAFDYLLKPVEPARLDATIVRLQQHVHRDAVDDAVVASVVSPSSPSASTLAVDQGGRTVMIDRSTVIYVEAAKDYSRLRTADGAYLMRLPISTLEAAWAVHGWIRVHRSFLVPLSAICELRQDTEKGWLVKLGRVELPVSRRHLGVVRDLLHRSARAMRAPEI